MLRTTNLYRTAPRLAILQTLLEAQEPLTKNQIAEKLGPDGPDKVTIYRTLDRFRQANLIHKAYVSDRAWHFETPDHCGRLKCHPHFTCTNCGRTQCLTQVSIPLVKGLNKGFVIRRQQVKIEGLCPRCSTKQTKEDTR